MKIELSKERAKGKVETQSQSQGGQIVVKAKSSIGPGNEEEKCQIDDLLKKSRTFWKIFLGKLILMRKKLTKKVFWIKF